MDKYDLRDLIDYSKRNNIEDKPIQEVYQLYKQEWEKAINSTTPQDSSNSTTKKIKRKKRRKWTKEENTYLLNKIKENPNNLLVQFNECAKHLDRTPSAIKNHWYAITTTPTKDIATFTLISSKKAVVNRKNSNTKATVKSKESLFTKIINILFK